MKLTLIVPAPFGTVSGGYVYDSRMVAAWRLEGKAVNVVELAGSHPMADNQARQAARACLSAIGWLPAQGVTVIDGLALPAFAGMAAEIGHVTGLIHHPVSMETALGDTDRAALAAIEKRLFPALSRVIVTSETTAHTLVADFAVPREKIAVITPGTDPVPRSSGSGGSGCHVLSVGTLIPRKGHDVLLRALARLFDLDWHLTIVGSADRDPAHAEQLAYLADTLGIASRVTFAGEVVGAGLQALWQRADLFALATHYEGYGMAVAEALAHGLPVAITQGGAAAALVPIEGGVVCVPGDADGLSKAMRRLIFSADLRRAMGDTAWQAGQALPTWKAQGKLFIQETRGTAPYPIKGQQPL